MSQPLDFEAKLFSIRQFRQINSPEPEITMNDIEADSNLQSTQSFNISSDRSIVKAESEYAVNTKLENEESTQITNIFLNETKLIKNLSSTIDSLFAKIEKIKSQFQNPNKLIQPQNILNKNQIIEFAQNFPLNKAFETNKQNSNICQKTQQKKQSCKVQKLMKPSSNKYPLSQISQEYIFSHNQKFEGQETKIGLKIQDFIIGRCVGSGKFGDVFLSIHKQTQFICAIKKILKSTILQYRMEEQLVQQIKINYYLNHPNIVNLYGHFTDQYHIFLVMEYANDGILMDKLKCNQQYASRCIDQLLDGIQYMHNKGIMHRDIKPQNVVVFFEETVKICDFGWASSQRTNTTFCGTLDYVSPEMKDLGQYNESVDIWSIGVLTFELIAGFPPFKYEISHWKLCGSKLSNKWRWSIIYPPDISDTTKQFIQQLLKEDPRERLTIAGCKQNNFILKHHKKHDGEIQACISQALQII